MKEEPTTEQAVPDPATIHAGLRNIRKRRFLFWFVILVYVPVTWIVLEVTKSDRAMGKAFAVWLVFLVLSVIWLAPAKCPQCGNLFHMHGTTFFPYRKCLHCGLGINADKRTI